LREKLKITKYKIKTTNLPYQKKVMLINNGSLIISKINVIIAVVDLP
jgi:hypothetical protein